MMQNEIMVLKIAKCSQSLLHYEIGADTYLEQKNHSRSGQIMQIYNTSRNHRRSTADRHGGSATWLTTILQATTFLAIKIQELTLFLGGLIIIEEKTITKILPFYPNIFSGPFLKKGVEKLFWTKSKRFNTKKEHIKCSKTKIGPPKMASSKNLEKYSYLMMRS